MTDVLDPAAVDGELAGRGIRWRRDAVRDLERDRSGNVDVIVKEVDCGNFAGALAYVNRVGELAEAANHHPDVDIRWKDVTLRLTTHSAGGLTERDLELAAQIDDLDPAPPPDV